ncbi:response regulator, partial [bacterium]|nr:response regulator [bacterium]
AAVTETRPDLVLMDILLAGEMDGITAATEIDNQHDVPIVFLTAHADHETLERAKTTRPHGYIVKPFSDNGLRAAVELAIHRHAIEKEIRRHHQRLDATLNGLDDAVIITDALGIVAFMNSLAVAHTGWSLVEAEGRPLPTLVHFSKTSPSPLAVDPVESALRAAHGRSPLRRCTLTARDGSRHGLELASFALRDRNDMVLGVAIIFRTAGTGLLSEFEERTRYVYRELFQDMNTLGSALVVCAWCRRVQDAEGRWVPMESMELKYASRWITHGICPTCQINVMGRDEPTTTDE